MTDADNSNQQPTPDTPELESFVQFSKHLASVHQSIAKSYSAFAEIAPDIIANIGRSAQSTTTLVEVLRRALDRMHEEQSPILSAAAKLAPLKQLYDVEATQQITGLGRQSLYNMAHLGRIESVHIAGRLKFSSAAITTYLLEHQTPMEKSLSAIAQLTRQAHERGIELSSVLSPNILAISSKPVFTCNPETDE